jgi:hypothetical protein
MTIATVVVAVVGRRRIDWDVASLGIAFGIGLIGLLVLAQVTAWLHAFSPRTLGASIVLGSTATWLGVTVAARRQPDARPGQDTDRGLLRASVGEWDRARILATGGLLIVTAFALGLAAGYRLPSPVPFQPNWDAFAHLRVIDGLLRGQWSIWTSDYSTTFRVNAYLPVHHLAIAMGSWLAGVSPLAVYWGGPVAMYVAFGAVTYALAWRFTRRPAAAVIAGCASIAAAFPMQAFGFLGLAPASLSALLLPLMLLIVADATRSRRSRLVAVVVLGLGSIAAHLLLGPLVLAFGLVAWACREILATRRWFAPAVLVSCVTVTVVLGLADVGAIHFPGDTLSLASDSGEHELTRTRSLEERRLDLERHLALVLVVASGAGATLIAARTLRRPDVPTWMAAMWAGSFVVAFLPFAGADRAFVVLPTVIGPPLALLVDDIADVVVTRGRLRPVRLAGGTAASTVLAVLAILAIQPASAFVRNQELQARDADSLTSFGSQEVDAARAIRSRTPASAFLISDPLSQEFLGGLADRESYGGGPFASDPQIATLRDAFDARSPWELWTKLRHVALRGGAPPKAPLLVALEGRTARWLTAPPSVWVGYYAQLDRFLVQRRYAAIQKIAKQLDDDRYFLPVWRSDDVRVYAIRPNPGAPVEGIEPAAP